MGARERGRASLSTAPLEFPPDSAPARRLRAALAAGRGVRIGETGVLSTHVHVIDRRRPDTVTISLGSDAGEAFYGWRQPGQVYHLDLFHAEADVPPAVVAAALRRAGERYWPGGTSAEIELRLDRFDLQTGAGGGRATGSLGYGRRPTLRAAHRNHVHVAARIAPGDLAFFFAVVAELERALGARGVEIRRVARLVHASGSAPADLSPYADQSDSHLRPDPGDSGGGEPGIARDRPGAALSPRTLAELADAAGGLGRLSETVDRLADAPPRADWGRDGTGDAAPLGLVRRLQERGLAFDERGRAGLTPAGRALRAALHTRLRDLEAQIRQSFRRPDGRDRRVRPALRARRAHPRHVGPAAGPVNRVELPGGPLDVAASVLAAAHRCPGDLRVTAADLRVRPPRASGGGDVCLLIDCSASMAGKRMSAARFLARHLLLSSRDRVAVLVFHETEVRLAVPFTRRYRRLDEGVARLVASGLTPMAHGLCETCDYLRKSHARRALLLLITDGIPTVPRWTVNPIEDAMRAAEEVARGRFAFGCIGLEPSRTYLEGIARRGGGRLYVLDDLEEASLAGIARRELAALQRGW